MIEKYKSDFLINRIVDKMTQYLIDDMDIALPNAMNIIYNSQLLPKLQDLETGLYMQSPGYVYSFLKEEINKDTSNKIC